MRRRETKMAARNAKHSISTILRKKIGDCEQYTSFRSALSELTNVEVTLGQLCKSSFPVFLSRECSFLIFLKL